MSKARFEFVIVSPGVAISMKAFCIIALLIATALHGAVCVTYHFGEPSDVVYAADGRISGVRDRSNKDFVLGGLFHVRSEDPTFGGGRCGTIRVDQDLEAMLFAMDLLNSDTNVLPGLEIGYDLRDTCTSENVGLDETIDLILTGSDLNVESCESANVNVSSGVRMVPTVGIVGAAASRVSIPVASLGRLFSKPQVSYASTSPLLSNRDRYTYFFRTIPPDDLQARAIIDLLLHFNWTHISTIYSKDPYGQPGTDELKLLAKQYGMCIDLDVGIEDDFVDEDYRRLADQLVESNARVVVLFTHEQNVRRLLTMIDNSTARHRFTWIGVDAWSQATTLFEDFRETVAGFYGFVPLAPKVREFDNYYSQLTIQSNRRNPWFPEIFAAYVVGGCSLDGSSGNSCPENISLVDLPQSYVQSNLVPLITDAVYAFAHALHNFLGENCYQPLQWNRVNQTCAGQRRELSGSALLEYLGNVTFDSPTGNRVQFNELGSVEGKFEIESYYAFDSIGSRTYEVRSVGTWIQSRNALQSSLNLTETVLQFGIDEAGDILYVPPLSQCGQCTPGQYRREVVSSCCGDCTPCLGQNFSNVSLSTSCLNCSILGDMWGNNPLQGSDDCVPIRETILEFSHPWSVTIAVIALIGLICVVATAVIFGIYWKTKVIKASGREQMITLMAGIVLSFLLALFYLLPPVLGICAIQRIGVWFCFSLMFGAILVKIIRVARIFLNTAQTHIRFTESYYQVIFTILIVIGQLVLVIGSIGYQIPAVRRELRRNTEDNNDFPTIVVTCVADPIVFLVLSVCYESLLIIASTVLGVMSFKYPANFNEAKCISFCTFALLVIWLVFIPSYFTIQQMQEFQNAAISMAITMSAFVVLICIFGPKLFIIFFWPELNKDETPTHHGTHSMMPISEPHLSLGPPTPQLKRNGTLTNNVKNCA